MNHIGSRWGEALAKKDGKATALLLDDSEFPHHKQNGCCALKPISRLVKVVFRLGNEAYGLLDKHPPSDLVFGKQVTF